MTASGAATGAAIIHWLREGREGSPMGTEFSPQ
jgi:hypothetical protein